MREGIRAKHPVLVSRLASIEDEEHQSAPREKFDRWKTSYRQHGRLTMFPRFRPSQHCSPAPRVLLALVFNGLWLSISHSTAPTSATYHYNLTTLVHCGSERLDSLLY